jgi:Beta-lactamase
MTRSSILFTLTISFALIIQAQIEKPLLYFPKPGSWEQRSPASLGMDSLLLSEAVKFALDHENKAPRDLKKAHYQSAFGKEPFGFPIGPMKERGPATGLIIRKGYIVAKWGEPERIDLTFSVAKSFLSSVAGLAFDDKLIADINSKVYVSMAPIIPYRVADPNYGKADEINKKDVIELFESDHNKKITWDHLLRQTSDWQGTLWGKPDWADRPSDDPSEWLNRKMNEPGTVYEYNDTRVNVLALALLNVWRKPLPTVLKERIMDAIGASPGWRWTGYENSWVVIDGQMIQSVSGGSHWGGGMFINAYDQARFGYLTLRNGKWNGKPIISEDWIKMSRKATPVQSTYGFMNYFLNTDKKLYPSAPASAFAHIGAGTNMIYVDQENDIVIVARWIENNALDGLIERTIKSIKK